MTDRQADRRRYRQTGVQLADSRLQLQLVQSRVCVCVCAFDLGPNACEGHLSCVLIAGIMSFWGPQVLPTASRKHSPAGGNKKMLRRKSLAASPPSRLLLHLVAARLFVCPVCVLCVCAWAVSSYAAAAMPFWAKRSRRC